MRLATLSFTSVRRNALYLGTTKEYTYLWEQNTVVIVRKGQYTFEIIATTHRGLSIVGATNEFKSDQSLEKYLDLMVVWTSDDRHDGLKRRCYLKDRRVAETVSDPDVLLLQGFPEIWYSWRYQVIAFRQMQDFMQLLLTSEAMDFLIQKAFVVGKGFGAMVALSRHSAP
ncbi:hypothetical protein SUGI_0863950 [Cryptomeria japonica]|nr:hypothetical protein SUGI_0863950 [Cryptomeria japonica]